ncbi:hypothetical protein DPMN_110626 [Dreissena polymorpha]|uniref:Actin-like ATPase domain-containing protein n=1 Tax=Dreissena polymorpha TaxID=45954 RepID=A0A9D4KCC9_DREPO|nr:hypothetical protein DPMN_110626 [Dreissena polymorpha]
MSFKEFHFLESIPDIIVALDIGRSTSRCALYLGPKRDQHCKDEHSCRTFPCETIPSKMLLNNNVEFMAFGSEAIEIYNNYSEIDKRKYIFFDSFDQMPHSSFTHKTCPEKLTITDKSGKQVSVQKIFTFAIKCLVAKAFKTAFVNYRNSRDDVLCVIALPCDSSNVFKQCVFDAAIQAGMLKDRIRLVSNEQAILTLCQEKTEIAFREVEHVIFVEISRRLTAISIFEIGNNSQLKQQAEVCMVGLGGDCVNREIITFMKDIVGIDVWKTFQTNNSEDFEKLLSDIETMKRNFSKHSMRLHIPKSLQILYEQFSGLSFSQAFIKLPFQHKIRFSLEHNRLIFSKAFIESFFLPIASEMLNKLKTFVFQYFHLQPTVVIIGGFVTNKFIQELVYDDMRDIRVLIPASSDTVVVQGSLQMGRLGRGIEGRITRFSYGIPVAVPFINGVHPIELKKSYDGEDWCENAFAKLIERGQVVRKGDVFTLQVFTTAIDPSLALQPLITELVVSKLRNPSYCIKEEGCAVLGRISRHPPATGWPKLWRGQIELVVGDENFTLKVYNFTTGDTYGTHVDFA